ncbi:hypothetical protein ACFE04_026960 [Oxalis oulophora]
MKRPFDAVGSSDDDDMAQRRRPLRPSFRNVVGDVIRGIAENDFMLRLETRIRKVVREEVESVLHAYTAHLSARPMLNQIEPAAQRAALQLRFINKLPGTIFTGSKLEAEEGGPIKVVLYDPNTDSIVNSGPLSCIKIEILALDGEFGADDQDNWSQTDFDRNIVRERDGKRPLVTGDITIVLRGGVATLGEVIITDNSSWLRGRKFRLGAKVVQRISGDLRIREARTEAFIVKDHRGELYKKHYPPRLIDEVWRLEKIAKEGAFHQRLAPFGIHTVKDFLQCYETNQNALREMLGGISNRIWEQIVMHASQCVPDDKLYSYTIAGHGVGLLFNSVYKLVGATFDGQNYQLLSELMLPQKMLAEKLKRQAYDYINDWVQVDEVVLFGPARPLIQQAPEFAAPSLHHDFSIINQGNASSAMFEQLKPQLCVNIQSTSNSNDYEMEDQLDTPTTSNVRAFHLLPQMSRSSFRMNEYFSCIPIEGENVLSSGTTRGTIIPSGSHHLTANDNNELFPPSWSPANWGQETSFYFGSSGEQVLSSYPSFRLQMTSPRKSRVAWCKIKAVIKLRSVKRDLAARRGQSLYL